MRGRWHLVALPRPSCSPIHCSSNSLTDVSASVCTPVRIGKTIISLLLNSKIMAAAHRTQKPGGPLLFSRWAPGVTKPSSKQDHLRNLEKKELNSTEEIVISYPNLVRE